MFVDKKALSDLVAHQTKNMFNISIDVSTYQDLTLKRLYNCFKFTNNNYYNPNGITSFSPLNSSQYSIYLYYLANTIFRQTGPQEIGQSKNIVIKTKPDDYEVK